ncbi:reverse transcriptase, partial [Tanacetum coccineum]
LELAWLREEMFWHQRSRVNWLNYGDRNSRFFHLLATYRGQRNKISGLKNTRGEWVSDQSDIQRLVRDHFGAIFTTMGPPPVTDAEIHWAAKQLGGLKAPGEDGFPGHMVPMLNKTLVALIPKTSSPETLSQFRPISLCNFIYKIISKVLSNRLKPLMSAIISPQQSAFIPGRQIQDSMVVAHEAFHYIRHKKRGSQNVMALKLDLNKAFDRVEWDFLLAVLRKMGFGNIWCNWIHACLTTYELEFMVNGDSVGIIRPQRGLRQGDPISPYLFIIVADVLSRQISKAMESGSLSGIKMARNCPIISHIFFADDSLFFLKVLQAECGTLTRILDLYCQASDQSVNFQKSSAFFSPNTPPLLCNDICDALHVQLMEPKSKYLGLPSVGRKKGELFSFLLEKVLLKMQEIYLFWTQKWVSYGEDFYVRSPLGPFNTNHRVSDFIINGEWNYEMLCQYISKDEANIIRNIPISQTGSTDKLVWHFDAKGHYTVKSGYKQAILAKTFSCEESSAAPSTSFWKQFWKTPTQLKVRLFLWKVISNCVPTMENLYKRNCSRSPLCLICSAHVESIEHMLFECAWTRPVWFGSPLTFRSHHSHHSGNNISLLIQSFIDDNLFSPEAVRVLATVATTCWSIWKARNSFIYDNVALSPTNTLASIYAQLAEFDRLVTCKVTQLTSLQTSPSQTSHPSPQWIPPHESLVKINCDAAYKEAIAAFVVRDSVGSLLYVQGNSCFATSPLHAEVIAIHSACRLAYNHGWVGAIVESDCQIAISLSSTETIPPWSLGSLIEDIRTWSKNLHLTFSWTNQSNNQVAHWTAQFALS